MTTFREMQRDILPRPELERRWRLLRALLKERGLDACVTQGANTQAGVGGYFRWVTGSAVAGSYHRTIIFTADAGMSLVSHGVFGGTISSDPAGVDFPGVERRLTEPSLPMVGYTQRYDAQRVLEDLRHRGARRVGLIGPMQFAHGLGSTLEAADDIEWVDITDEVDLMKAQKSAIEIELMRAAAAMQDRLIDATANLIRPGIKEYEIAIELNRMSALEGSLGGFVFTTSGRLDQAGAPMFPRTAEMQGRTLNAGDLALILIENAGPGGMVTHMARIFALGDAPDAVVEAHDHVIREQDEMSAALVPGASPAKLFADYNARMRANGLPEEKRIHAHGQGYDIVERPLIRSDETMEITANMNIGIHPMVLIRNVLVTAIDNYLTGGPNGAERLHKAPRQVIEVR